MDMGKAPSGVASGPGYQLYYLLLLIRESAGAVARNSGIFPVPLRFDPGTHQNI